jgi:hypothetical protein
MDSDREYLVELAVRVVTGAYDVDEYLVISQIRSRSGS